MNQNVKGIIFIILHSFCDISFYIICKHLQQGNIHNFNEEIIFVLFYNLKALLLLIILFILMNCIKYNNFILRYKISIKLNKKQAVLYLTMSIFSALGFLIFLYGLKDMLMANAMSLKYLEQVLWIAVGAFILKEKINIIQLKGILISCIGIIIIMVDGMNTNIPFFIYCCPLIAALCWTISSSIGKYIVSKEINIIQHMVFYYIFHTLVLLIICMLIVPMKSIKISNFIISLESYEFLIHILSMTFFYMAMKIANMSLLAPFVYIKLIFSFILGSLLFSEVYNLLHFCAYILIISGGIKILSSVRQKDKENKISN